MSLLKLLLKLIVFGILTLGFLSLYQHGPGGFWTGVKAELARF